jgi:histidinol-phosphatase
MPLDLARALAVARAAARAAAAASLPYWRRLPGVEWKADGSPVTAADRSAEAAARAVLAEAFPDHAVFGEEEGARGPSAGPRWVVDPLDGTRGFARGGPFWGPLVALEEGESVLAGAVEVPVAGLRYAAARGLGCWRGEERLRLGPPRPWRETTLSLGEPVRLLAHARHGAALRRLAEEAACVRALGDVAAVALVLEGVADAWLEAGVQFWDLAAPRVLLEEAGAVVTDLDGRRTHATGSALAAAPALHAHALAVLAAGS